MKPLFLPLLLLLAASLARARDDALFKQSLLYGLANVAAGPGVDNNTTCNRQLDNLRTAIEARQGWALRMLDSSGSPGPSFLWGNNYWLGSREQCLDIPNRSPLVLANSTGSRSSPSWPPYDIQFYLATFRLNSSLQIHVELPNEDLISAGLCLPSACSPREISLLLRTHFVTRPLLLQSLYDVDMRLEQVRSLQDDGKWILQPGYLIVISLLLFFLSLVVLGTVYDTTLWQPHLRAMRRTVYLNNNKSKEHVGIIMSNNNQMDTLVKGDIAKSKPSLPEVKEKLHKQGALGKFLQCFSAYSNTGILLDTQLGPESVGAVHGLRFMGMGWILMVHTVFYSSDFVDNKPLAFRKTEGFMVQVISNSTLSVDTFFFLSGFLVAYLFYRDRHGKQCSQSTFRSQLKEFGLMVLRRFVRLTPAYLAVLGIVVLNMSWYSRTTLFHMTERADILCSHYWWRNLLYINNFFSREEMCMSWSWYLSNDMQFFIIAAFLLILSTRCFTLSATILVALVTSSSLLTGYISYSYNYVPTLDKQFEMLSILYDPPWTRIGPHMVGVATGYLVVQLDGKLPLRKHSVFLAWLLGSACNITALFGLYERNISPLAAAVYVGLNRTAWGVGLAWIMVACCTHNAGIINSILSFRGWIPLSRLTYCAYLINPMLMSSVYLSSETPQHIDFLPQTTYFLGYVGTCYFCAYAVSLVFEAPNVLLMRWAVGGRARAKNDTPT